MGEIINQEVPYTGKGAILHKGILYTGGGSNLVETVLWTNPSPNNSFVNQNVTLSDDIDNYDYLKFVWKNQYNTTDTASFFISVLDFKTYSSGYHPLFPSISGNPIDYSGERTYVRYLIYISDTSIAFGPSAFLNWWGQGDANDNYIIPTQICGVKKTNDTQGQLKYGTFISSGSTHTFDCGINDPDMVFIDTDRNANDWCAIYTKPSGNIFNYLVDGTFSFGSSSSMNRYTNSISVNGSQVTVDNSIMVSGLTYKYVAIKG